MPSVAQRALPIWTAVGMRVNQGQELSFGARARDFEAA
jgi:hypothetical protein